MLITLGACGREPAASSETRIADVAVEAPSDHELREPSDTSAASIARAAGGSDGRQYTVRTVPTPGVIIGTIDGGAPRDTSIMPTHDLGVCRPFSESIVPSRNGGVGNAVVWLMGIAEGPRDDAPRRVKLTLDGCRLDPRVQRVAQGGTVMVSGRDAMMSRLKFFGAGEVATRATVLLSDAGQIVPTSAVTASPSLVEVRDDMHPWVRAWLVVAPHPFVAVTDADGTFRFDGVPPGRYTMVVWHERLGVKRSRVRVDAAVQTLVDVRY